MFDMAAMAEGRPSCSVRTRARAAFSLIELVIVVVIIGVIAAIAIPRMGQASAGASDAAFAATLRELRGAIDRYYAEHGVYPSADPLSGNRTSIMLQLTQYTDDAGNYSDTRSATYRLGPYLGAIPALPVSSRKGRDKINTTDTGGAGWLYDPATGDIRANTGTEADAKGRLYSSY